MLMPCSLYIDKERKKKLECIYVFMYSIELLLSLFCFVDYVAFIPSSSSYIFTFLHFDYITADLVYFSPFAMWYTIEYKEKTPVNIKCRKCRSNCTAYSIHMNT